MNAKANYKRATNAAYRLLLSQPFSPSVDVFSLIGQYPNCRLLTYRQAVRLFGFTKEHLEGVSTYGFSIVRGEKRFILYNDEVPFSCIRFTLAHELGHMVLGHLREEDEELEKEANCFARNLLCPQPVVKVLNLTDKDEYMAIFNVSAQMASVSLRLRWIDNANIYSDLYGEIERRFILWKCTANRLLKIRQIQAG